MQEAQLRATAADGAALPAHEQVYRALRDRILFGEMAPGEPVTIQGLVAATGAGMTPVREAIRRLIAEGALLAHGNRRVSVPVLGATDVEELLFARLALEPELARRATLKADRADRDRLAAEDAALDAAIARGDVSGYLRRNHGFHSLLYATAAAPVLESLAAGLWLRFGPSMRVVCGRAGTGRMPDRHKELLAALAEGNPDAAAEAMRRDVGDGMALLREAPGDSIDSA
ncbi:GntR family transcriptional regulator [Rhodosalinus halophilus]|uniref:GntR family transcriptional regulator n=1 Tax=Rhodosalinus halophilus TaxID=2259333 RepID=A0A365UAK0_9RHOB|nr:GntR family transcriptional regulator [Rhodosalinus halophilus]RBI85478.1 GntR family transcriptional regulator [Rhodosalinus halophilus]